MTTYKIVRFFEHGDGGVDIGMSGLTLEEAQEYCSGIETSSKTCTNAEGMILLATCGPWFDGYTKE